MVPLAAQEAVDSLAAFAVSDRRCRAGNPTPGDFLNRARDLRAIGDDERANADLRFALEQDPMHPEANAMALEWLDGAERAQAASRMIASGYGAPRDLRAALRATFESQSNPVHRLQGVGRDVQGWIAWAGDASLPLEFFDGEKAWIVEAAPNRVHPLAGVGYAIFDFVAEDVLEVSDARAGRSLFRRLDVGEAPARRAAAPPGAVPLTVIVPVHGGWQSTQDCLESLFSQQNIVFSLVVVDDCSPDPRIAKLVDDLARRSGVTVIRNVSNLGFAKSINKALRLCMRDDVLLLNSDVWLPPTAIARLRAIAISDASIGTVTPFSNNSQTTSFPRPYNVNPMPTPEETIVLDGVAEAANGSETIDLPSGIGFCQYITRACLDAVEALPEHYGRGYYEDVEYSLLAKARGFRSVCATGVFVAHHGSSSFLSSKRELVARNMSILESRFPSHRLEFAAFAVADPLRSARAAIEARIPPKEECVIVVASEGRALWLAQRRAKELEQTGIAAVLIVFASGVLEVEAQRVDVGAPVSLRFNLDSSGTGALAGYLARLRARAVEVFDAADAPEALVDALLALGTPIDLFGVDLWALRGAPATQTGPCASPGGLVPCRACHDDHSAGMESLSWRAREVRIGRVVSAARNIRSLDRMGAAFARRVFGAGAGDMWEPPYESTAMPDLGLGHSKRIGILAPIPSLASDRIAVRLARLLARPDRLNRIVVFGSSFAEQSLLETGAAWVTGPANPEEFPVLARQYGVGRLALFDRSGFFGPLDAAARRLGTPKAYFDWSFGALAADSGDLAIDPRVCDAKAASAVALWLDSD